MIHEKIVDAIAPSPAQVLDLIVRAEKHRRFVWTAGRVLKEAALWKRVGVVSRPSAPQRATRCCARRPAPSRRTFGRDN
jgi:hypothetical protein